MGLADELARLAELHKRGELSDAEYESAKQQVLAGTHDRDLPEQDPPVPPHRPSEMEPTLNVAAALASALNDQDLLQLEGDEEVLAEEPYYSYIDWSLAGQHDDLATTVGLRGPDGHAYLVLRTGGEGPWRVGQTPRQRATNGMAVASLVLGIVWVYGVGSILALIFGYLGLSQIKERQQGGRGLAIAGIVLGWIGVAVVVLAVVLVIASTRR